jgi:aminopeptidase YwaD
MKKVILSFSILIACIANLCAQQNNRKTQTDPFILSAVHLVEPDSLITNLQHLQDFGTRFMIAPNRRDVALWIMEQFTAMGIPEVRLDSFLCATNINYQILLYDTITWQYNVEAKIPGTSIPQNEIIVMAHYDSVTLDGDNMTYAPGADDNGSGTVALFEIARVLKEINYEPEHTIILLATAAEELMYFGDAGSEHYAQQCTDSARNIVMVMNNDMIGWDNGAFSMNLYNHPDAIHLTNLAIEIIEDYSSLNYVSYPPQSTIGADLQPFLDAGYPGVYFMESGNYPFYHTSNDIFDYVSSEYLAEITKVNIGMILKFDMAVANINAYKENAFFSFYPNPVSDILKIITDANCDDISIFNSAGIAVMKVPFSKSIDVSHLPEGFYTLIISTENGNLPAKFLKFP